MMKPKVRAVEVLIITLVDITIYIVQSIAQAITLALASAMATPEPQPTKEISHVQ